MADPADTNNDGTVSAAERRAYDKKKSSSVDDIIAGIETGADSNPDAGGVRYDAQGRRIGYVGVADDFRPMRRPDPMSGIRRPDSIDPGMTELTHPYYESGYDEETIANMSDDDVARLQIGMVTAGLLSKSTTIRFGKADDSTVGAYKKLITYANQNGLNQHEALNELQSNPEVEVGIGPDGQPTIGGSNGPSTAVNETVNDPMFTDALTARATLRDTLSARLNRAPTADEYYKFKQLLSNEESGQDVTTQTTTSDGQGNTKTRVKRSDDTTDPSVAELADNFSRRGKLGREANTVTAAEYFDIIRDRVGGS